MKRSFRLSLVLLTTFAMFSTLPCVNAAVLDPLKISLGPQYSDSKRIESLLGQSLTLPSTPKDRQELINATSRLTQISVLSVRQIVAAMLSVQVNYSPALYAQHPSLFAEDRTKSLGLFLSIIRQVDNIMKTHRQSTTIVHTASGSCAGLQSHYLTGILAYLKYERIFINIVSFGALEQFGRECRVQTWAGALDCVRAEYNKLARSTTKSINVNVYPTLKRYMENVDPQKVASLSNSSYLGDLTIPDTEASIDNYSQDALSAFDITASQICKAPSQPPSPIVVRDVVMVDVHQ